MVRSGRLQERLSQKPPRDLLLEVRASLAIQQHIGRLARFYEALNQHLPATRILRTCAFHKKSLYDTAAEPGFR